MKKHYKVVTQDLKSLGLRRNKNIMLFKIGEEVKDETMLYADKRDNGGIWVANGLGNARSLKKYMAGKGVECRIFLVEIGIVLFSNSYRTKTDKVKLVEEVLN